MNRCLGFLLILVLLTSCAKRLSEEVAHAIDVAQSLLSDEKCDEAIEILEDAGRQPQNAVYLQVLASAYACKSGFNTITFIAHDLDQIAPTDLFASLTSLSLSAETEVDSLGYRSLTTALEILQSTDKQIQRTAVFGKRKSGDLGIQIAMLSLVNLGKFLHYYGNVNNVGKKGLGGGPNKCFINYTSPQAIAVITSGITGACASSNSGHPEMSGTELKRRMCEGSTMVANIVDVILNIDLPTNSNVLEVFEQLKLTAEVLLSEADAAGVGHLVRLTSKSECETLLDTATEMNQMQNFYAALFEVGLQ